MKKVKQAISIEKSVFILTVNGQKLSLSIEDLRTLRFVIDQKLGSYPNYHYGVTTTVPYLSGALYASANSAVDTLSTTTTASNTASISIGEENE